MSLVVKGYPGYPGLLEPSLLPSEAKWRKLKIDVCSEEELEEMLE
jgi:hypothetical protein